MMIGDGLDSRVSEFDSRIGSLAFRCDVMRWSGLMMLMIRFPVLGGPMLSVGNVGYVRDQKRERYNVGYKMRQMNCGKLRLKLNVGDEMSKCGCKNVMSIGNLGNGMSHLKLYET
ncbi:hypothetical protein AKJ16_DCAP04915 [Drosera capensis]